MVVGYARAGNLTNRLTRNGVFRAILVLWLLSVAGLACATIFGPFVWWANLLLFYGCLALIWWLGQPLQDIAIEMGRHTGDPLHGAFQMAYEAWYSKRELGHVSLAGYMLMMAVFSLFWILWVPIGARLESWR